MFEMHIVGVCR